MKIRAKDLLVLAVLFLGGWLFESFGWWAVIGLGLLIGFGYLYAIGFFEPSDYEISDGIDIVTGIQLHNEQDQYHLEQARDAWESGDFDTARREYLKCAQGVTSNGPDEMKPLLKMEQTNFARADSFIQDIIERVKELVNDEPGILQTQIYKKLNYQKQDIQTALYFGHELGDFYREKSGRSYAVHPVEAKLNPERLPG